jgi:hypothetical protein
MNLRGLTALFRSTTGSIKIEDWKNSCGRNTSEFTVQLVEQVGKIDAIKRMSEALLLLRVRL